MSQTHTIVVRFPAGIVPRYSAATEFQGGQVVAIDFEGDRLTVAMMLEESLDRMLREHEDGDISEGAIEQSMAALRYAGNAS